MIEPLLDRIIVEPVNQKKIELKVVLYYQKKQETWLIQQFLKLVEVGKDCETIEKGDYRFVRKRIYKMKFNMKEEH